MNADSPLLEAVDLTKRYPIRRGIFGSARGNVLAVDRVSFRVRRGETLGLVGESGSGKTTTGRLVVRLEKPDAGKILLEEEDWLALSGERLRRRRGEVQIVFQDPHTSLNPRMTAGDQIAEPLRAQGIRRRRERAERVDELLSEVGLSSDAAERFPSEFSGGQRQRIAIARALATRPRFVVCDEPVSALDVSVAAQIVNLLLDLREKNGLSYLFISHDLALVARLADRIAVMYRGRIVEEGPVAAIVAAPAHPYTAALLSAVAEPDPASVRRRIPLRPDASSAVASVPGCPFEPRCPIARARCREEAPPLASVGSDWFAACFYPGELAVPSE